MRYIIETTKEGEAVNVWNTINSLQKKDLITIVEKGDPLENMKIELRKIARAVQLLKQIGIDREVMEAYIYVKTKVPKAHIRTVLWEQEQFFKKLGVELR